MNVRMCMSVLILRHTKMGYVFEGVLPVRAHTMCD